MRVKFWHQRFDSSEGPELDLLRLGEIRLGEIRLGEIRRGEIKVREHGLAEHGPAEHGPTERGPTERGPTERGNEEHGADALPSGKLESGTHKAAEARKGCLSALGGIAARDDEAPRGGSRTRGGLRAKGGLRTKGDSLARRAARRSWLWTIALMVTGLSLCPVDVSRASLLIQLPNQRTTLDFETTVSGVNEGRFAGRGIVANPMTGQLDASAWSVVGFSSTSDLSRGASPGQVSTGGLYAFETALPGAAENVVLGVQPTSSDFTPGSITLTVENGTNQVIEHWSIGYDVYYLNNGNRSSSMDFEVATDGQFRKLAELDFSTPREADGLAIWKSESREVTLAAIVQPGDSLLLRWTSDDLLGSGSRDEFGIDNVGVVAEVSTAVPEPPSSLGIAVIGCLGLMCRFIARKRDAFIRRCA